MENDKKNDTLLNGIIWIIVAAVILFVVHCLFKIQCEDNSFFRAVWEAGDLITFIGTVTLGFVSYTQTKKASDMAKRAEDLNKEFLKLQFREYMPLIECLKDNFCGLQKFGVTEFIMLPEVKICTMETTPSDKDEDPRLGYGLTLICQEDFDLKNNECRTYEMHFRYSGKYNIKDFAISNISFLYNDDVVKEWEIDEYFGVSLSNNEEFILLLDIFDNYNSSIIKNIASSNKIKMTLKLQCFDGSIYIESMDITKHLVKGRVPSLKKTNVELMLSAGYDLKEV